jgi:preprotein translocase subunit SecG
MVLFSIALVIFVIVCIFLCLLILIQSDKGGGLSGALGGGFSSATNLLGSADTANILTKATSISAGIFLGMCLILSIFMSHPAGQQTKSALKSRAEKQGNYSPSSVLQGQQGLPIGAQGQGAQVPPQGIPQGTDKQAPALPVLPAPK